MTRASKIVTSLKTIREGLKKTRSSQEGIENNLCHPQSLAIWTGGEVQTNETVTM